MSPNTVLESTSKAYEYFAEESTEPTVASPWKHQLIWLHVVYFLYIHIAGVYGMYIVIFQAKGSTIFIGGIILIAASLGITAAAHRYFCHRSYKVTFPLEVLYMLIHSLSYQKSLVTWIRDHRMHHKYSDTDADPHNSSRGFFFSHIGWILVKHHPEFEKRKNLIDMRDVYSSPVMMFQKRNSQWLLPLISFGIPTAIPWLFGETITIAWFLNIFRLMINYNLSFLINSLAHSWGYRPYDSTTKACQSLPILFSTLGEGFHNYHHAFPWDYRGEERKGNIINFTTMFIDFCGKHGLAYDMKTASKEMIVARMLRTGDGTDMWGRKIIKNTSQ